MAESYAIDTAARFGEIPFVEFTKELVTGVFDCLVEAHTEQMETYIAFINSLTQSLSDYINNTVDNVSFSDISDFVLSYQLPKVEDSTLETVLGYLQNPGTGAPSTPAATPSATDKWWQGLVTSIGPAISGLVDKVKDSNLQANLQAIKDYNDAVQTASQTALPSYANIQQSIAALIASNKYSLLQNMAKMGLMRLVVTEGRIVTRITFSTWNTSTSGTETSDMEKAVEKAKTVKGGSILGILKLKKKNKTRMITVNTAKSYQRDTSGSRVDIFGEVVINFKTDYAPLNA
jgi:hypothetical protein